MAQWTKYNNPNKRKKVRRQRHSREYIEEQRNRMYELLGQTDDPVKMDLIIKAFHATINP